ncbi:MAG: hypothetical protein ACOY94_19710 [Bacillota bacterium]
MKFNPLAHYLAQENPRPEKRRWEPTAAQILVAIVILFLAVGWLPHWLYDRLPP